jgi:catechol 2,3-dioxygenase-like lactoylglutathione lyase family enzyme
MSCESCILYYTLGLRDLLTPQRRPYVLECEVHPYEHRRAGLEAAGRSSTSSSSTAFRAAGAGSLRAWLDAGTGLPDAHIRGIHLRLPGGGESGPTLEIFQYNREEPRPATAINRPGLTHLAFAVADVEAARQAVLDAGGTAVGDLVSLEVAGAGRVTFAYVTDPEGNIIELQRWSH